MVTKQAITLEKTLKREALERMQEEMQEEAGEKPSVEDYIDAAMGIAFMTPYKRRIARYCVPLKYKKSLIQHLAHKEMDLRINNSNRLHGPCWNMYS
ncbi:hypothetical protein HN747_03815 [archaeon]|jgi:hypothetical protein|nr:hypothetical protein [archaeon]